MRNTTRFITVDWRMLERHLHVPAEVAAGNVLVHVFAPWEVVRQHTQTAAPVLFGIAGVCLGYKVLRAAASRVSIDVQVGRWFRLGIGTQHRPTPDHDEQRRDGDDEGGDRSPRDRQIRGV